MGGGLRSPFGATLMFKGPAHSSMTLEHYKTGSGKIRVRSPGKHASKLQEARESAGEHSLQKLL